MTGKQFTVQDLGAGKVKLTPLDATDPIILKGKVLLNGAELQGLPPGTNPIVEIEGAGTATAGGKSTTLKSLEANGTLMEGTKNGVTLTGGEAKITTAPKAAATTKAAATPKVATTAKAQTVALTKPAATKAATTKAAATKAATTKAAATKAATTTGAAAATQAATGGSIWSGTGWGLGLGLGLGVWGTVALGSVVTAAVGIGVYNYMKRSKADEATELGATSTADEATPPPQEEAEPNAV
uniref:Uncharacterized protein n=1 Tax=Magnetococcus massalia (strain MO-1) TaxID=451514 RepID=A0A1S7LFL3_MAGMO|nr:Conserved hypothetical protein. Similar to mmc1_2240/mms6 protein in MC-1 [Candidatus Magnetococcus massalia]